MTVSLDWLDGGGVLVFWHGCVFSNNAPLSLAHEERLHGGSPLLVVGSIEHGDEGIEGGRHFCKISSVISNVVSDVEMEAKR